MNGEAVAARRAEAWTCAAPEDLAGIARPEVSLAIWLRPVDAELAALVDALPVESLPHLRIERLPVHDAAIALPAAAADLRAALHPLLGDIVALVKLFGEVAGVDEVRLRLERVSDDACRYFHADRVRLRLLCSYRGPGTEWVPDRFVRRDAKGGTVEPAPEEMRSLRRFDVGLLKGTAWRPHRPCLHRSPPIAGSGMERLLLCIDEGWH